MIREQGGTCKYDRALSPLIYPFLLFLLLIILSVIPIKTFSTELNAVPFTPYRYWPQFPVPQIVYVPNDAKSDAELMLQQSVAGLVGKYELQGKTDALLYCMVGHGGNNKRASYEKWLEMTVEYTHSKIDRSKTTWDLVDQFKTQGFIKGYILYRLDHSERAFHTYPGFHLGIEESPNVATSLAGILDGVMVDESLESQAQKHGLKLLMDAHGKTEDWAFHTYKEHFNRKIICVQDPKAANMRDYAIAIGAFCMFGVSGFYDEVLEWLDPDSPSIGWNGGDEYKQTYALSKWGDWQGSVNWSWDHPFLTCLTPGKDIPLADIRIGDVARKTLYDLNWEDNAIYHAFVLSDGDAVSWTIADWALQPKSNYSGDWWDSPLRGNFNFGWGMSVGDIMQLSPVTLKYFKETATPKDEPGLLGGGYYYPDNFGGNRNEDIISLHIQRLAPYLKYTGVNIMLMNYQKWDSPKALEINKKYGQLLNRPLGLMTIQYSPSYASGHGEIKWVPDNQGTPMPIVSCKYTIWGNLLKNSPEGGTPGYVAELINKDLQNNNKTIQDRFSWTIVHCWSYFKDNKPNEPAEQEDVNQDAWKTDSTVHRGYTPVKMCIDRLDPRVRVVTPEELLLQIRLYAYPQQTLGLYLKRLGQQLDTLEKKANPFAFGLAQDKNILNQASVLLGQLDNATNQKKCFTLAKQADESIEKSRLSMIALTLLGNKVRVNLPPDMHGMFYYDVTELDPQEFSAKEIEIQWSATKNFKQMESTQTLQKNEISLTSENHNQFLRVRAKGIRIPVWGEWSEPLAL